MTSFVIVLIVVYFLNLSAIDGTNEIDDITKIVQSWNQSTYQCMWRKRANISVDHPFVFFHQRKSSGSTLRLSIHNVASYYNMSRFIPMFDKVKSGVYKVPVKPKYSIYAGHFSWSSSIDKIEGRGGPISSDTCIRNDFSCLTSFREPLSRLESCIYERFMDVLGTGCINDMSIKRFTKFLITKRHRGLFSCLNEPFRIFGSDNETIVSSLGIDFDNTTYKVVPRVAEEDLSVLSLTMKRMSHCVPIVLEIPESMELLKYPFPFLYEAGAFERIGLLNPRVNGLNCSKPTGKHLEVMKNVSQLEDMVYQMVASKVRAATELSKTTTLIV